jgi:LuxR family maltose regulon positive regulatory protein
MSTPILTTKLYIPPTRPELVPRPRLIERLNDDLRRKLTLISAPAGFGKTTLVSGWLRQLNLPIAWLSLDEGDSELPRFLSYTIAALQEIDSGLGQTILPLLQLSETPATETLITLLINDVVAFSDKIILIFDDYHVIHTLEIHQALTFLLERLPPQLHLVVISREDPPFPLARLRVRQQIREIRSHDLQFSHQEAAQFLNQTMRLNLRPEAISALEQRTEGWIAGLQMAAIALQSYLATQDEANPLDFIEAFAGDDRYVVDYLIVEVLERQPAQVQAFLLHTSILKRFTASLCDAVTEQANGRELLTQIEGDNLFLIALDNRREWYRYHHLFGDLLRYRLKEAVGVKGIKQLHQRAATWYAQNGFTDEAIHHYLTAEDFTQAANLMETVGVNLIVQGQLRKVCDWLEALPEDFIRTRSLLCVCHAWALNLSGQAVAVPPRLQDAEQALPTAPPAQRKDIQGLIYFVQAFLARRQNNMPLSTEYLRQAAERLSQNNLAVRGSVNLNLGFNYFLAGQLTEADQTLQVARRDGQAVQAVYITLIAMAVQANTYVAQGRLRQAVELYEEAIAFGLTHNGGRPFPPAGYAYAGLGQVLYEQNDLDRAEQHLAQAVELGEMITDWSMIRRGLLPLAWLKQRRDDSSTAHALWQQALNVVQQAESKRVEATLRVHQARLWLAQATTSANQPALTAAAAWARAYQQSKPDPCSYPQALAQLTLAWLRMLQGQASLALAGLEPIAEAAAAGGQTDNLIKILTLQALAQSALGDVKIALATLNHALNMAASEGYIRTFVDYGPPMRQLLQRAASHHIAPDYVATLLTAFTDTTPPPLPRFPAPPPLIEPLSDRERQVLRLLANGLSNQEIADALIVSVNTVRTHLRRIYAKLAVNNRTAAVSRAQELELL